MSFFKPTKQKLVILVVLIVLMGALVFFSFSINEKELAAVILFPLLSIPLGLFDFLTSSTFSPKDCFFLCLPTTPQLFFLVVFDVAFLYTLSCLVSLVKGKSSKST